MSTQFVSQAKLDANRANAQHSTGPRTIQGKTTSSSNGMKLGFNAARFVVLPEENREDFDNPRERLRAEHKPATDTESILVDNMAKHHWLMNRALHHQNVCVDLFNEVAEKRL